MKTGKNYKTTALERNVYQILKKSKKVKTGKKNKTTAFQVY